MFHVIRKITQSTCVIKTIAGVPNKKGYSDGGLATKARLHEPNGICFDESSGSIYFADGQNHRIRTINSTGYISTVAGVGTRGFFGENILATEAVLASPLGLVRNKRGVPIFLDSNNYRIRKIRTDKKSTTMAGTDAKVQYIVGEKATKSLIGYY